MPFSTFFIDLDDTLYARETGIWGLIRHRMEDYMHQRLGIPQDEVSNLRIQLYKTYGTTMRGLEALYHLDTTDFLQYVHDVPVGDRLQADPALAELLESYPQRKIIFTNADVRHAERVLGVLGISGCFDRIIDVVAVAPYCKPDVEAFRKALELCEIADPHTCVMFDDSPANLATARSLGMYTVLIHSKVDHHQGFDACLPSLHGLPDLFAPAFNRQPGAE